MLQHTCIVQVMVLFTVSNQHIFNFDPSLFFLPQFSDIPPQALLLLGGCNAHNPPGNIPDIWLISQVPTFNICYYRLTSASQMTLTPPPTTLHGTLSFVDVTLYSSTVANRFKWHVSDDSYTSDHFPVILTYLQIWSPTINLHHNFHKVDWDKYSIFTRQILP